MEQGNNQNKISQIAREQALVLKGEAMQCGKQAMLCGKQAMRR